jgi:hypothetical protein
MERLMARIFILIGAIVCLLAIMRLAGHIFGQ